MNNLTTENILANAVVQGGVSRIQPQNITDVEKLLIDENKNLRVVPFSDLRGISQEKISLFCVKHGFYQIVTSELVEFVGNEIKDFETIEIGAGGGTLGRALKIPITDSRMQERLDIRIYYKKLGQAVIRYPADVEKKDALSAVRKYRPDAVIGAWITHKFERGMKNGNALGVDESAMSRMIRRYVFIGNETTHSAKPILRKPHKKYRFPWIISRSLKSEQNAIWIWDFEK